MKDFAAYFLKRNFFFLKLHNIKTTNMKKLLLSFLLGINLILNAQVGNDDCSNATLVTVNPDTNCTNVISGTTVGSTNSDIADQWCFGNPSNDVWYKFVATGNSQKINFSNIAAVGTSGIDAYFQVLSGNCSAFNLVFCGYADSNSNIISGLTVGQTYYLRVYSYTGANVYNFNLCINTTPPSPVNDDCSGALLADNFPYSYTQTDAQYAINNNPYVAACPDYMNDGLWFKFQGDGDSYTINVTVPSGVWFYPAIGVYSGACDNLLCETMDYSSAYVTVPTVAGKTYYVNVGNVGTFDMLEEEFTININKGVLGTSDISSNKNSIKIYPNPVADILNVSNVEKIKSITISDASGRIVKEIAKPTSSINVSELKSGAYLVAIYLKDGSQQTIKTIKK